MIIDINDEKIISIVEILINKNDETLKDFVLGFLENQI